MRALISALVLLAASPALAGGGKQACSDTTTVITAQTMESSRSFEYEGSRDVYGLATIWIELTDANTSITSFVATCTTSHDNNTTDYTPQECTSTAGTYACVGTGIFTKASPSSIKWPIQLNLEGFPDFECTFSVGAGAGAAADLLTVKQTLCTKGG